MCVHTETLPRMIVDFPTGASAANAFISIIEIESEATFFPMLPSSSINYRPVKENIKKYTSLKLIIAIRVKFFIKITHTRKTANVTPLKNRRIQICVQLLTFTIAGTII